MLLNSFVTLLLLFTVCFSSPLAAQDKAEGETKLEDMDLMERRRLQALISNLGNRNYVPFEHAVRQFEEMGIEAVPHLVRVLRDKDRKRKIHINAIYTLGRIGPAARRAVPTIISYVRKGDEEFKAVSAIALGKIGKHARDAVGDLAQLLFDDSKWVKDSARTALKRINTEQARNSVKEYDELQKKVKRSK